MRTYKYNGEKTETNNFFVSKDKHKNTSTHHKITAIQEYQRFVKT